jgi:predicted AAA+ superfamily ATPase
LSRLPDLSRIEMLASLLPERVGSLVSIASLREDLEVSHDTVRRWVEALSELYYLYELKPYHRGIRRSLRKEGKIYLWDYSEVEPQARASKIS